MVEHLKKAALAHDRIQQHQNSVANLLSMKKDWESTLSQLDTSERTLAHLHEQTASLKQLYREHLQVFQSQVPEWLRTQYDAADHDPSAFASVPVRCCLF